MTSKLFYEEFKDLNQNDLDYRFRRACESGNLDAVKYLLTSSELEKHAYINCNDGWGVMLAFSFDHLDIVDYLLTSSDFINNACSVSQLKSWEKIFSWWHIIHIPFIYLLVFSSVIHVIAAHMY